MTAPAICPGDKVEHKGREYIVLTVAASMFDDGQLIIVNTKSGILELNGADCNLTARRLFREERG